MFRSANRNHLKSVKKPWKSRRDSVFKLSIQESKIFVECSMKMLCSNSQESSKNIVNFLGTFPNRSRQQVPGTAISDYSLIQGNHFLRRILVDKFAPIRKFLRVPSSNRSDANNIKSEVWKFCRHQQSNRNATLGLQIPGGFRANPMTSKEASFLLQLYFI